MENVAHLDSLRRKIALDALDEKSVLDLKIIESEEKLIQINGDISQLEDDKKVLKNQVCYIMPSHEYVFLIDLILYLYRSGWSVLVWR
jgi:hypothetical protein